MSLFPNSTSVIEVVAEVDRVVSLPRRPVVDCERRGGVYPPETQALVEYVTDKFSRGLRQCACREMGYSSCITLLNPVQAWTLREMTKVDGALGLIPVGGGKTIMGILAPLAIKNCRLAVLLAKPDQRLHYRNAYLRLREHFRVPSIRFDDDTGYIIPGAPVLHFVPYSKLSRADATDLLERLSPDFIICDEAHSVSARTSSRTGRLLRYLAAHEDVRFCAWSGTLIKKSIRDQAHLSAHALGEGSPMPLDPDEVEAWAAVFDSSPIPDRTSATARRLYREFDRSIPTIESAFYDRGSNTSVCRGYRSRLVETPGVISTRESSISASLYFHEQPAPRVPDAVKSALAEVRNNWRRPDGEELVEKMEQARCAREVASGFFYYWAFIHDEPDDLIEDWFAYRKSWNKELRQKLLRAEVHLDSPLLCANAAERAYRDPPYVGELPLWAAVSWPSWANIKDQVNPDPRVKWIDDYLARDAAKWAREHRGIVWSQSSAFGKKVAELAGLPYHGGGPEAEERILAEDGSRSIVASIRAHGAGRDGLQLKFSEQLVAELPSSGDIWQQLLGRLCRPGQESDEVHTWVYLHVSELKDALKKAKRDADFTNNMTGSAQLLLNADMDFIL